MVISKQLIFNHGDLTMDLKTDLKALFSAIDKDLQYL